jgi:hypothetical protein
MVVVDVVVDVDATVAVAVMKKRKENCIVGWDGMGCIERGLGESTCSCERTS